MQTRSSKHAYRVSSTVKKQSQGNNYVSGACMCVWGGEHGTEFLGPPEPTGYM